MSANNKSPKMENIECLKDDLRGSCCATVKSRLIENADLSPLIVAKEQIEDPVKYRPISGKNPANLALFGVALKTSRRITKFMVPVRCIGY